MRCQLASLTLHGKKRKQNIASSRWTKVEAHGEVHDYT